MSLTVTGDRVLIQPISQKEHDTASKLYTVEDYAPDVLGKVVAIGAVDDVKVDDVVIFPPSAGQRLSHDGEQYLILHIEELLGVWE